MHFRNASDSNVCRDEKPTSKQYSRFGSSREQYFHMWRSFHYDENTDTIDSYILKIKQVASLLNYGEPEILKSYSKTLCLANYIGYYFQ